MYPQKFASGVPTLAVDVSMKNSNRLRNPAIEGYRTDFVFQTTKPEMTAATMKTK
jgi:hypothetical protein